MVQHKICATTRSGGLVRFTRIPQPTVRSTLQFVRDTNDKVVTNSEQTDDWESWSGNLWTPMDESSHTYLLQKELQEQK